MVDDINGASSRNYGTAHKHTVKPTLMSSKLVSPQKCQSNIESEMTKAVQ